MPRSRHVSATTLVLLLLSLSPGTPPAAAPPPASRVGVSCFVDGDGGGAMQAGLWTIEVPAGAFAGSARLSMTPSAASLKVCQLDITPAEKNSFSRPVTLTAHLGKGSVSPQARIEWYDPQTQSWKPLSSSHVDMKEGTVTATLSHFSLYQVTDGKNGW